jgi:hypothetical protein
VGIALMAATEGMALQAAIASKNYKAAAVLGALSLWGGTLRRGVNAAASTVREPKWEVEDLHRLTEPELSILRALWRAPHGLGDLELAREAVGFGSWADLRDHVRRLEKRGLVSRPGAGRVYVAEVTKREAARAFAAAGEGPRAEDLPNYRRARDIPEDGAEAEQPGAAGPGRVDP